MSKYHFYALLSVVLTLILVVVLWGSDKWTDAQANRNQAQAQQQALQDFENDFEEVILPTVTTIPSTTITPSTTTPVTVGEIVPTTSTSVPSTSTTTAVTPSTTTTTTIPIPVLPPRDSLLVNDVFAKLEIPAIDLEQPVSRANEFDDGEEALKIGAAWFPSSSLSAEDRLPTNNLSMPGEGGNVAIGAHRGGGGRNGPFGKIDQLNSGDEIVLTTLWGRYTYKVTVPCPENQDYCQLPDYLILGHFAEQQVSAETLYLFSCDGPSRVFVVAELVSTEVM